MTGGIFAALGRVFFTGECLMDDAGAYCLLFAVCSVLSPSLIE